MGQTFLSHPRVCPLRQTQRPVGRRLLSPSPPPPAPALRNTNEGREVDAKLRQSLVDTFNREWADSFDAGVELERCLQRMCDTMASLTEAGLHMHMEFSEPLQSWWVAYREKQGDLIPRSPVEAPV